ncbi:hypothetical protein B0A52_04066 [Exophiala mesophila]|uniref:Sin3-associated polypeptide Sap18 n=1 Tax=Exophiala mesophila TaxID=212818 RepID=A0A438NA75_EXOME|nr:hypothetical protein B0A52_04066 [Exophiala mesophila]
MSRHSSLSPPRRPASKDTVDRQTTTPFLLNFCYRSSAYHSLTEFPLPTPSNPHPRPPAHLQIYTWMSCTLKELAQLLTQTLPQILPQPSVGTRLSFRLVYPDLHAPRGGGGRLESEGRGRYLSKEMGSVVISAPEHSNGDARPALSLDGEDADKTLEDVKFQLGDFVDCAVFAPLSDGSVVGRGAASRGPRENGYGRVRGGGYGLSGRGSYNGSTSRSGDSAGPGSLPSGEWRRGERLPDSGGYRGGGRGGRRGY